MKAKTLAKKKKINLKFETLDRYFCAFNLSKKTSFSKS